MTHVVAYSGGLSSFEVARLLVAEHGPSDVLCVFTDTLTEDEDLYRFLFETNEYLQCELELLMDGRNIWEVFNDVKFMGNSRIDPCSAKLKREVFKKFLASKDPATHILYYGIGVTEKHRIGAIRERWAPFRVEAPLIALETTKEQMLLELDKIGIEPPRLYDMGFEHNNCGGFCVKTGQRQMALLLKKLPERYAWHEQEQEKLFAKIGPHGFIRRTVAGELSYLSLKQFRELVESGDKVQMFQDGSCGCFT